MLNDLMKRATQPVLVMMDARQRVEPAAVSRLLASFADPSVGVVSGALVYESVEGAAQKGAESYWGYEKFIRLCESRFDSVPGATGAFYAIRRDLCGPIPANTLVDDVLIPMRAVLMGYRCLFEPSARVFDRPSRDYRQENARKRRTLAGVWQLLRLEPRILSPRTNPIAFQWISHKFLRLLTPFFVLGALLSFVIMGIQAEGALRWPLWFAAVLAGGTAVSGLAYAAGRRNRSRVLGLLGAFWGVNVTLILAALDAWTGRFEPRWK